MNYTQNEKISQITPSSLIVGIDIAKEKHVARAQDDRGMEFGKRLIFENREHGFEMLCEWVVKHQKKQGKNHVIFGVEPTGHYWLSLAYYLKERGFDFVIVNPMHVKKSKELDDNSPTKNDTKDAKVIAQLIKDGRYSVPNLLEGIYAELREGVKVRDQLSKQLMITEGRIQNNLQRYFPEFFDVFKDWSGKAAICSLRCFPPFPSDVIQLTAEAVLAQWKTEVKAGVGIKRAQQLIDKANKSIGIQEGLRFAKREIHDLLDQYMLYQQQLEAIEEELEELVKEIPGAVEMIAIRGIGAMTVAGFYAEVGDIRRYRHPQQVINMAGYTLKEHSSGKHKGQTRITKRGRSKLRKLLYMAVRLLSPIIQRFRHYMSIIQIEKNAL
ncbi:mobile element protein [Gracilibacillus boraciitolerans JCM 21714]|uniref:Mobile element protein n=1 Tax=Gracilibacillus boraciitolerans JCM 21714 TaxID=1298598 RepID=W4VQK4_9BACI|nr:mobile element protein [Gracilibacillus boraciitolerans JCM 21714]